MLNIAPLLGQAPAVLQHTTVEKFESAGCHSDVRAHHIHYDLRSVMAEVKVQGSVVDVNRGSTYRLVAREVLEEPGSCKLIQVAQRGKVEAVLQHPASAWRV